MNKKIEKHRMIPFSARHGVWGGAANVEAVT